MTKKDMLKLKKSILSSLLVSTGTLSIVGCADNKDQNIAGQTDAKQETQLTTEVSRKENVKDTNIETKDFYALACEFERNYTPYCSETGLANYNEDGSINIDRIENIIKVINGEVADLTSDDVSTAARNIEQILLPQELNKACNFIHEEENGFMTIEGNFNICETPILSIYATNEETKEFLEGYENLRNEVIIEINSTNSISEETKLKCEKAVIDMQKEYKNSKNFANTDTSSEGNKLILNEAKVATIELANIVTDKARIYDDEFPGGLKLAPETYEEAMVIAKHDNEATRDSMTEEEKLLYTETTLDLIKTPYVGYVCSAEEILGNYANNNQNVYSQIDIDEIQKYVKIL